MEKRNENMRKQRGWNIGESEKGEQEDKDNKRIKKKRIRIRRIKRLGDLERERRKMKKWKG